MTISCSRCGADHEFKFSVSNVLNAVYGLGWGSYGAALYCPECTRAWDECNKGRPMPGPENTIRVIDEMYRRREGDEA